MYPIQAFWFVAEAVADTIAGIVTVPDAEVTAVLGAALTGAVTWNLITWRLGLPSSSGHALAAGFSRGFEVSAAIMVLALVVAAIMIRVSRQDLTERERSDRADGNNPGGLIVSVNRCGARVDQHGVIPRGLPVDVPVALDCVTTVAACPGNRRGCGPGGNVVEIFFEVGIAVVVEVAVVVGDVGIGADGLLPGIWHAVAVGVPAGGSSVRTRSTCAAERRRAQRKQRVPLRAVRGIVKRRDLAGSGCGFVENARVD
jgi:phosphate/sulfate permease